MPPKDSELLDALKLLALAAMTVDHVNAALLGWGREPMYLVGRIAFPVFVFAAAYGALRTRAPLRYLRRLLLCAIAAQPFFWLAFGGPWWYLNTVFTLFFGVAAVLAWRFERPWLVPLLLLSAVVSDYSVAGAAAIVAAALLLGGSSSGMALGALALAMLSPVLWPGPLPLAIGVTTSVAALLLWSRAGERTAAAGARYGFYVFYPAHLAVLTAARYWLL